MTRITRLTALCSPSAVLAKVSYIHAGKLVDVLEGRVLNDEVITVGS